MNISEIIKTSITYPMNDSKTYLIFGIICLLASVSSIATALTKNPYVSIIAGIISIIFILIVYGYNLNVLKLGIDKSEKLPEFDLVNQLVLGIKLIVVSFVYYLIPLIISIILAFAMGIPQGLVTLFSSMVNATSTTAIASSAATNFLVSLGLFSIIVTILFIIFTFFAVMGQCRLAKTGSIKESVTFKGAFADMKSIGILRLIAFLIVLIIIVGIITFVVSFIFGLIIALAGVAGVIITSIIGGLLVNSYINLFGSYALGLLYSDVE